MVLDFNAMEWDEFANFKGGEKSFFAKMYFDGKNRIMQGKLVPGASIGLHTHETNSETVFITSGTATMLFDGTEETLLPGMCSHCPKGHSHSLMNKGNEDVLFFAVVPEQS